MATTLFEQKIHDLNFSFLDKSEEGGVLLTLDYEKLDETLASPDILFALETARNKFNADAVYFRFFEDGRAAVPQLYLFDYTQKILNSEERNTIHIQMWNGYQVPVYIIIEKTTVGVFDSREKPDEDKDNYASEIITLTGDAIRNFNAHSFDDGLFWEEQNEKKHFKFEQSAARDLIRELKEVYRSFQVKSGLNRHVALKLLVQSLLIKYLEERDEDSASGYFAGKYFQTHFKCQNFCDVIRNGKLLDLLDQLAKDFNGKIFEWDKIEELEEREAIRKTGVEELANYLDGNIRENQFVFWRLYSFSHLPVEVLSSVYEELLTDSKDIVYTPEMIVGTLVDECMPLKSPKQDFKLIDVSCGSGIFLVKTYKRIVQWWRYEQWKETGELKKPPLSVLKELLLKSIYGIDIQQDAIRLSIFSLALAILDEVDLDPKTWGKLRFPDLSNNIVTQDFFEHIVNVTNNDFDLVIGNPPFNLSPVNGKEPSRKNYFKELKNRIGYSSAINIPDENPALHFLVQSMNLLKPNALLCMIQPTDPILYQKDKTFRRDLFSSYNLLQVIDFTKLSDKLWGSRNIATAAIFLQNSTPDDEAVLHLVASRSFSNRSRLFLEFDHYDFHFISKDNVLNNLYVWKANLLGGGRISQLLERFSESRTLGEYIESKKSDGWVKGEGFIENKNGKTAKYITGKQYLAASALTENSIDSEQILTCDVSNVHRATNELIFTPPHILIRANIGKSGLIAHLSEEYLVFRNKIIGVHAPSKFREELVTLVKYLKDNGKLLRFAILATSSQIKVSRHSVPMTQDFMDLPYPENIHDLNISEAENILIDDVLRYQLTNNDLSVTSNKNNIIDFSKIFCQTLNSIYGTDEKSFQLLKLIDAGKYYAVHFIYSPDKITSINESTDDLEKYISQVIPTHDEMKSTHIQKIMKVYGEDCLILVKPKQLRYWLPSIALRDADETFTDYVKARYENAEG